MPGKDTWACRVLSKNLTTLFFFSFLSPPEVYLYSTSWRKSFHYHLKLSRLVLFWTTGGSIYFRDEGVSGIRKNNRWFTLILSLSGELPCDDWRGDGFSSSSMSFDQGDHYIKFTVPLHHLTLEDGGLEGKSESGWLCQKLSCLYGSSVNYLFAGSALK